MLARMLVPALELTGNDVHADELPPPFLRILAKVFIVGHTAGGGTCELVGDYIDACAIWYLGVGIQPINLVQVVLDRATLLEFMNLQVSSICTVMVYTV